MKRKGNRVKAQSASLGRSARKTGSTARVRPLTTEARELVELQHDFQVHREESRIQNEQLIESQKVLEISRDRYVDLYDFAPIAIVTLCEAGVIREANLTAASLLGVARAALLETPFITLVAPEYRRVFREHLRRCRESGQAVSTDLEVRMRDGRCIPIALASNPGSAWPNNNRPGLRYHSAIVDLTERRAAEQAREQLRQVSQSEQLVRTVFDALPVAVRVIDPAGGMIIQNIASRSIWGERSDGVMWLGGKANRVGESQQLLQNQWPMARALRGETVLEEMLELHPEDPANDMRIIKQAAVPLTGADGTILGAASVSEDVTELWRTQTELRRAKRAAETASRLKDDFLATISHELRTPLSAVLLWSHLLKTGSPSDVERQREAVDAIYINAKAQSQIIDDLLDLSRMTTGKLKISPKATELAPVAHQAIESVRPAAQSKGIVLDMEVVRDPGKLPLDPDRMRQVVWNLLSNAIKFTPQGGSVRVVLDKTSTHARLVVSDTGAGIAPDFLPHVFDRFRQADSSTTRELGGLGLGLSIVKQLVEMHGGAVKADSPGLGMGATFTIELPLRERAGKSSMELKPELIGAPQPEKPADAGPILKGTRVLLVEDEPLTRRAIARLLEQSGAKVTSCQSVPAALEALENDPPDVLLSDLSMPGEDGLELIRKIRKREAEASREQKHSPEPQESRQRRKRSKRPDSSVSVDTRRKGSNGSHLRPTHLPAAALTARAMPHDRDAALQAGFEAYIAKPVDAAQLVDLIRGLVHGHC